jgi:hypothetical protein
MTVNKRQDRENRGNSALGRMQIREKKRSRVVANEGLLKIL